MTVLLTNSRSGRNAYHAPRATSVAPIVTMVLREAMRSPWVWVLARGYNARIHRMVPRKAKGPESLRALTRLVPLSQEWQVG